MLSVPSEAGGDPSGPRRGSLGAGKDGYTTPAGTAHEVPYVLFDYGAFTIQEYGQAWPLTFKSGPREGTAFLRPGSDASFTRNGVLVFVTSTTRTFPIDTQRTIQLAKSLKALSE